MGAWLALIMVSIAAAVGFALTVAAWRARRSTPRTFSLVLSTSACVCIVFAAGDCSIPLPRELCRQQVSASPGALEAALTDELGSWGGLSWWIRPCGRIEVEVAAEDTASSIDFGQLTATAVKAGIVIDVRMMGVLPRDEFELELRRHGQAPVPIQTPIPASFTGEHTPALRGTDAQISCRVGLDESVPVDPGASSGIASTSLQDLLGARSREDYLGFHRLQCWREEVDPPTTSYLQVRASPALIASEHAEEGRTIWAEGIDRDSIPSTDAPAGYGLELAEWVGADSIDEDALEAAAIVVFDRPMLAETCEQAKKLLNRGGTAIIALPGAEFMEACKGWLPTRAKAARGTDFVLFDGRPKLSFLLDDFADDLLKKPTLWVSSDGPEPAHDKKFPKSLEDVQMKEARRLCEALKDSVAGSPNCQMEGHPPTLGSEPSDDFVPVQALLRSHEAKPSDEERLGRSAPSSALSELVHARNRLGVFWENELVIVFTHDPRSLPKDELLGCLEQSGGRVHIATVHDPYGQSLRWSYGNDTPPVRTCAEIGLIEDIGERLVIGERPVWPGEEESLRFVREVKSPNFTPTWPSTKAQLHKLSTSRFFSAGAGGDEKISDAPVRFAWWEFREEETRTAHAGSVELASTVVEGSGLVSRPLAVGAMVGRGHLLLLAYSPFEWLSLHDTWNDAPETHKDVLGGLRPIIDLYDHTEDFLAELNGPVLAVESKPDDALWVTVTDPGERLMHLDFIPSEPAAAPTLTASLVDFDTARGLYTYALPASALESLRGCQRYQSALKGAPIHICPPVGKGGQATRADAALGYRLLAHYTGGRVLGEDETLDRDVLHSRPLGLGALALLFLVGWGRRARRRLKALRVYRRLQSTEQLSQRRFDPPDAVVAAAGDWDGRASTWPRTGTFGGYRPLEPGDRTSAIVLEDLVLGTLGGPTVLPRVSQRIEEAAPSVLILVNLGASMRIPGSSDESKAHLASRLALHIAAAAWQICGEVAVRAIGIEGELELVPQTQVSPEPDELLANLRARLRQRPARHDRPWPDDLPACGALVYISDFQNEDEGALLGWLAQLEGEGIRAAGAMVFSPLEFLMIEGGRLAGTEIWADRADWDPDDVFAAFSRHRDRVGEIFDATTTGGLVVADTSFDQDDLEGALEDGRLLQILR